MLTCCICHELTHLPFRCTSGHTLCDDCLTDMVNHRRYECPVCRTVRGFHRDRHIVQVAAEALVRITCWRCHLSLRIEDYGEHRRRRCVPTAWNVVCPVAGCQFSGTTKVIAEHLLHTHPEYDDASNVHIKRIRKVWSRDTYCGAGILACVNTHAIFVHDGDGDQSSDPFVVCIYVIPRAGSAYQNLWASSGVAGGSSLDPPLSGCDVAVQSYPDIDLRIHVHDPRDPRTAVESHTVRATSRAQVCLRTVARAETALCESAVHVVRDLSTFLQRAVTQHTYADVPATPFHREIDDARSVYLFFVEFDR